jgi:hypothetical protein
MHSVGWKPQVARTWCPDVILLYLVMVLPLAVPFFPDVLDNNGVAHLCAHEIFASKDLFDNACRFEPASGAYDPASLFLRVMPPSLTNGTTSIIRR